MHTGFAVNGMRTAARMGSWLVDLLEGIVRTSSFWAIAIGVSAGAAIGWMLVGITELRGDYYGALVFLTFLCAAAISSLMAVRQHSRGHSSLDSRYFVMA